MANLDQYGQPLRDPSSAVLQRKYALAQALQRQGMDTSPVVGTGNTSMQAIARVLQGGIGGYLGSRVEGEAQAASDAQRAERERAAAMVERLTMGAPSAAPAPPPQDAAPAAPPQMTERLGGAPPVEPPAPVPPVQQQALLAPVGPSGPPSMYGRNAGAAAQRDAMLDAPPQVLADASSARAAQSGLPTNVAYRGATPASEGGDWDRGVPAPTGAVPAFGAGGSPRALLASALAAPAGPAATPGADPDNLRQRAGALRALAARGAPGAADGAAALEAQANRLEARQNRVDDLTDSRRIAGETREEAARRRAIDDARDNERLSLARRQDEREAANQPLERIKNPDGSESMVPRSQAAGRVNAAPAPDTFGRSNTLRDEYRALTGDFRTVQTAFQNIQQASKSNNGAGDMSMLYSYVKMLDPGSVVRESEFATAAASGSFGERIQGAVQRVISGERLPDTLRQSFVTEAKNLHTTQRRTYDHVSQQYRGLAERNRLNPDDVVTDFITPEPAPPAAPAGTAPPAAGQPVRVGSVAEARQLPSGTPIILPDGSQGRVP